MVKNPPARAGDVRDTDLIPGSGRSPGGGHGDPLQYLCLENLQGQRSLVGYSLWGHKESDTTERLSTHAHGKLGHPALPSEIRYENMLDNVRLPVTRDRNPVPMTGIH